MDKRIWDLLTEAGYQTVPEYFDSVLATFINGNQSVAKKNVKDITDVGQRGMFIAFLKDTDRNWESGIEMIKWITESGV